MLLGASLVFGYRMDEIMGKHLSVLYTPEDVMSGVPARELKTTLECGRHAVEGWRMHKDGTRFFANIVISDP